MTLQTLQRLGSETSNATLADAGRSAFASGFSLIEVMMALAISSIVAAASIGVVSRIAVDTRSSSQRAELDEEAKMLGDYLSAKLQGAGGGGARPWQSITVEDNFSGGSDRITIFTIDDALPECEVNSVTGVNLRFDTSSGCCMDQNGDGVEDLANQNTSVILILSDGSARMAVAHNPNVSGPNCRVNFPPGQQTGTITTADLNNTQRMIFGKIQRYSLDTSSHQLIFEEGSGSATMPRYAIADRVYDLQFALGYDANPRDGQVNSSGGVGDEWLYNASGDVFGSAGLTGARSNDLRMIGVGLALGAPDKTANSHSQLFNRSTPLSAPGIRLRQVTLQTMARNLNLFY